MWLQEPNLRARKYSINISLNRKKKTERYKNQKLRYKKKSAYNLDNSLKVNVDISL